MLMLYHAISISFRQIEMHSSATATCPSFFHNIFPFHLNLLSLPLSCIVGLSNSLFVPISVRS